MRTKSIFKWGRVSAKLFIMGMFLIAGIGGLNAGRAQSMPSGSPSGAAADEKKVFPEPIVVFAPKSYVCYKTRSPLAIDGKLNESAWKSAAWTDYFVDIEGETKPRPRFKTRAKMLWDEKYFYIGAELDDPDVWATLTERDSVIYEDNDFELFIDPDGDTHNYYELEVNALNTVWDLLLLMPYRDNNKPAVNAWDIQGLKTAVSVNGSLNKPGDKDRGWSVEIAMPWEVLKQCAPNQVTPSPGDIWRINFSRVEHQIQVRDGKYARKTDAKGQPLLEDNWVWSPQGVINMHYPEQWGYVQFSGKAAGEAKDALRARPEERGRWALRILYYCQKTYFLNHGAYSDDIVALECDALTVPGFKWPPVVKMVDNFWNAALESNDGKTKLYINQDGKITK